MPPATSQKSKANGCAETEPEAESAAEPAASSAPATESKPASDPVPPSQSDARRRSSQTSWKQVCCTIVLVVLVGVALDSMPGAHKPDADTPHKSNVFSSAHAMQSPFGKKEYTTTTPRTCGDFLQGTRKPTARSSQDRTESTFNWRRLVVPKMNPNVTPCEDFYSYACGRLINNTTIPDGKQMVSTFTELTDLLQDQLLSLVSEKFDEDNITVFTLPNALYQHCMNKARIEKQGTTRLFDFVELLGGWPVLEGDDWHKNFAWSWDNMLINLRMGGHSINYFFDVSVSVDSKNPSRRIIYIDQPTLSINREYLTSGHPKARAYLNYTIEMALLLGAEEERAKRDLEDSVLFEMALANISLPNEERRNVTAQYNNASLNVFQFHHNYADWVKIFNGFFVETDIEVDYSEIVVVRNITYLNKLGELLSNSTNRTVANYVMQRVINYSASFLSEAMQKLQQKYIAELCDKPEYPCLDIATESLPISTEPRFNRKHFEHVVSFSSYFLTEKLKRQYSAGLSAAQEQQHRCLDVTTNRLPIAVGALYIRKYFNDASRRAVLDMANDIKSAFGEILKKVDWMTELTRKSALKKLESMVIHIGYPDELMDDKILTEYYKNLVFIPEDSYLGTVLRIDRFTTTKIFEKLRQPINKTDWTTHSSQTGVDAFYCPTENSIQFSANYLQGQLFSNDRPKYMNYGAIGSVMGRAITRGFYDQGQQFDRSGNPVFWWQTGTKEAFQEKIRCIREQYGNYTEPNLNRQLSGYNTFVENMADNGGIKVAYYAYKKWAEKNDPEPPLPDLDLTPEQLFWVSAAQSWYSVYRPKTDWLLVAANDISPAQFRVLGSMSNMIEFSEDFNCPCESPMNPSKKCKVW